jgi:DNA repair exonuclease SbcCD nuclease subunit
MKIAIVTDTHWGTRNDNLVFSDHISSFYAQQFFPYIDRMGITTVFHLGDVCDRRKFINYATAMRLENDFIRPLYERKIDTYMVVGNHDTYFKNTNDINSLKQLYLHSKYTENMHIMWEQPVEYSFDGVKIVLCPWINQENYEKSMDILDKTQAQIVMGHFEIQGFEMYKGSINHEGMEKNIFNRFEMVCSGHFHHKSSFGNIHYLGAPYEMTWSDYDDPRGFHVFDTEKRELTFIQNENRIFHKLWYDDVKMDVESIHIPESLRNCYVKVIVQNKSNPYLFDLYINKLQQIGCADIKVVDDHMHLDVFDEDTLIDEAEDTLTILRNYVDQLEIKSNKKNVETFITSLYSEAINL